MAEDAGLCENGARMQRERVLGAVSHAVSHAYPVAEVNALSMLKDEESRKGPLRPSF